MVVPVQKGQLIINVFPAKKNLSHTDTKSESPSSLSALTEALYVMTGIYSSHFFNFHSAH